MANECTWNFQLYKANDAARAHFAKMMERVNDDNMFVSIFEDEIWQAMDIPKWNTVDEVSLGEDKVFGRSAWSEPNEIFAAITEELSQYDPAVCAIASFDDEGLDFIGAASYFDGEEVERTVYDREDVLDHTREQLMEENDGEEPSEEEIDDAMWEQAWDLVDEESLKKELDELVANCEALQETSPT